MSIATDWEELSRFDPLWAILTEQDKRGGKWDLGEFFARGEKDASSLLAKAQALGLPREHRRCLDFGCGVGRITRAMRGKFAECHGVDVSLGMVTEATRLTPECKFHHNPHPDLRNFESSSFDLVYSFIVLQHTGSRRTILRYIEELLRVLANDGLLVFQLPERLPLKAQLAPKRRLYTVLRATGIPNAWLYSKGLNPMHMGAIPHNEVSDHIEKKGGRVVGSEPDLWGGPGIISRTYYATK